MAAIAGTSSSLLELSHGGDESTRRELLQTVVDESQRLARLVDNLLEMTRIESGAVQIHKQWNVLKEVVGSALHHAKPALGDRPIRVELPANLPLIPLDGVLIEQVLVNVLENAAKYSHSGTPVEVQVRHGEKQVVVEVLDRGHGLIPAWYRETSGASSRSSIAVRTRWPTAGAAWASRWQSVRPSSKLTAARSTRRTVPREVPGSGSRRRWKGLHQRLMWSRGVTVVRSLRRPELPPLRRPELPPAERRDYSSRE